MKRRQQLSIERRLFIHLRVPLLIDFRLIGSRDHKTSTAIKGRAWDVSRAGLCLDTQIEMKDGVLRFSETEGEEKLKVLPYLVSSEKEMRLELNVPPERKRVVMKGSPIWYEMDTEGTMSKLKFGVFFTDMPREVRNTWVRYIERRNSLSHFGGKD